jgi:hypothetical protein
MPRPPRTVVPPPPQGDYTQEVHESDLQLFSTPIYGDEAGGRPDKPSNVSLAPCAVCGVAVILGMTALGDLVPVEPQTSTYSLLWASGERYPRLKPGRGYPAHRCRDARQNEARAGHCDEDQSGVR